MENGKREKEKKRRERSLSIDLLTKQRCEKYQFTRVNNT